MAFLHESSDEIEAAAKGETEADRETPDEMMGPEDAPCRAPKSGEG